MADKEGEGAAATNGSVAVEEAGAVSVGAGVTEGPSVTPEDVQAWRSAAWRAEHATENGKQFVVVTAQPCFV
jgi:hypothetical protein